MTDYTSKVIDRFWSKVDLSKADEDFACWEWKAGKFKAGYGALLIERKSCYAHRIGYEIAWEESTDGWSVCHHCDNPRCCNPNHLFLGTHYDNMQDKIRKGRQPTGERCSNHKLTDDQVNEIRQRYAAGGTSYSKLAKEYNVDQSFISYLVRGKRRRYLSSGR